MRSHTLSSVRLSAAKKPSRRFITRHRFTLSLVLFIVGAVILSSILTGARAESRKNGAAEDQIQGPKPDVLTLKDVVKIERHGGADVSGRGRESSLSGIPPAGALAVTLAASSNNYESQATTNGTQETRPGNEKNVQARLQENEVSRKPKEEGLIKAHTFDGDLRELASPQPVKRKLGRIEPTLGPGFDLGTPDPEDKASTANAISTTLFQLNALLQTAPAPGALAPATTMNFDGLDFATWGQGRPPRSNGDAGPTYYVQAIDASIGIFRKSDGVRVAAFSFNTFMSQGNFGNVCDTHNQGDPIVLYDSFEDRWVITDFAFNLDGSSNIASPTASLQCIAVSKTGDPVSGGWNYYSINTTGGRGDAPKLGIWPDGLYMSVNMEVYTADRTYLNPRVYAFNKAQMYAGSPTVQSVSFDAGATDFGLLPSNARLQTGTPPPGSPNYVVSTWVFRGKISIYKFHVDWNRISASTFTGPEFSLAGVSWPNATVPNAPSLGGNDLEVQQFRAMMQNQYTNISGAESLWATHTVRRFDVSGFAAPRWYQADVTGGTVAANLLQATTYDPDGANVIHRFLPSLAVNRMGDMALGYSTSSSTTKPAIKYAGRLSTDAVNTFSQTEQLLIQGAGAQTGNCGAGLCNRWGDYSSMTLDPDGCTFWYTNEYYAVDGPNPLTRIGSFSFPGCTAVGAGGTVSGTVTDSANSNPINGATVALGSRTTTTNASGVYTFSDLPAGTYPSITASFAGYGSSSAASIVVADTATTTQNFSLTAVAMSGCPVDTSQADFQTGVSTNVDLSTSVGDIILFKPITTDQQNTSTGTGTGTLSITTWGGQTFTPAVSGTLTKVDITLLCSACSGTTPNLTLSVRATASGLPTGADIASATIPGFASVTPTFYTAIFASPPTLTAGTKYALIVRPVANPSPGSYGIPRSGTPGTGADVYAGGTRIAGATSGTVWSIPLTASISTDAGFRTYMDNGFLASGDQISGLKDANPAVGFVSRWTTLSWTTTTPANTTAKFQAAASNSVNGPFSFVGPDGTASTFFTSGASISQFNGFRYLKYKALLTTTDSLVTPTVNDVTVCFDSNTPAAPVITPGGPTTFCAGGSVTLTSSSASGNQWHLDGNPIGGATNQQYIATAAGNYTDIVTINGFTGAASTATTVVVNPAPATPTITPGGPTTFCAGGSVTLTSSSASGNQWYLGGNPIGGATNQTYEGTASGGYTVTVTGSGCTSASSAATTVTVTSIPATPTITPGGPTTFCAGGSVTLTSSSASGNQWYLNGNPVGGATNQTYDATAAGGYTTIVTASGCSSGPSAATTVTVNPTPATPTITPGGPTTFCEGGSVTLTSSSASGNQWYLNGNPVGGATSQTYVATAAGGYTTIVTASGCSSSPSAATTVTVNPTPATPTITPGGPTTFCAGGSVTLTSSNASGNQWYLNGNPIGGATNQAYSATASGNYTTVITANGCPSAPSSATTVTVNPTPATPTITPDGPTTFCEGGSVTLTSSSASGNQWFLDGNPVGGATNQTYVATASGNYTNIITASGCSSSPSAATAVTVTPTPTTPTITPGGPTTFCENGSVTLTSSSATGNQWYLNGNPVGGATNQIYVATSSGSYTTIITASGCSSSPSSATAVTVNPTPATPTITPAGPTTFCVGGSVNLTSSSAIGNQWYLNGNPVGGATNQTYVATASGDYTTIVTANGCSSSPSTATTVTVNPIPTMPTITPTGATTFCASGSVSLTSSSTSGNQWYLNGNPIGGATSQQYDAASSGNYTVTVTTSGCTSPPSTVTAVTANTAPTLTYPTPHTVAFAGTLNITPTTASDNGTVTYQVLTGHGLTTAPTVNTSGEVSITNAQPAGSHTITVRVTDNCGVTTDAAFDLQVQSPADVRGSKTASGTFAPLSTVTYNVVLSNSSAAAQLDNAGNEFTDLLPSSLTLISANASSGSATATPGTNTVTWNGAVAGSGSVTITIAATIKNIPDDTLVSNQGVVSYDGDGNGTNEATRLTDDPSVGGGSDPTIFRVADVNDPPVALDDTLSSVVEDSGIRTIAIALLLSNDTNGPANESEQTFTLTSVSNPVGGTVTSDATNVYFTPAADFNGAASFQYTLTDNGTTNGSAAPNSDTATVSFTVTEVNDAPTAVNNPLGNMEQNAAQRTIPFSVLTNNDSKGPANESGQTLTVKTVSNPVGLTVSIVAGTVQFMPLPNYNGPASFKYTIEDNGTTNGIADPKTSGEALVHFNITSAARTPSVTDASANAHTQTTSGLVISRNPADGAEVTHFKITGITHGTLFKNDGVTPINNGDFITFAEGNAGLKFTTGTSNGSFTVQASLSASDSGLANTSAGNLGGSTATATIFVNSTGGVINFSAADYSVPEGAGSRTITVERSGDTSQAITVDYASSDHGSRADLVPCTSPGAGFASSRCDFATAIGTLRFAAGEASQTFIVLINQDNFVEGPETLNLTLSNLTGGAVFGLPSTAVLSILDDAAEANTNPINNSADFVTQQYHDILGREPDAAGLAFWTDNIEKCNDPARRPAEQPVALCVDKQRESTAIAFFMSPELQMTGGFVYHLYKGSLTGAPNYDGGSPGRLPTFLEFVHDMRQVSEGIVVNNQLSGAVMEGNRNRLVAEFVRRPEFVAKYGGLNDTLFVQELFNTTSVPSTTAEKDALVAALTNGTETRASVLRKVVDGTVVINEGNVQFTTTYGQVFINQENRRLFVYLEYVAYLRRDPDTAGFNQWVQKLNEYDGDPFQAEMVRSFILSPEYRSRFGQP